MRVPNSFRFCAQNLLHVSLSGAYKFDVVSRYLENLWNPGPNHSYSQYNIQTSVKNHATAFNPMRKPSGSHWTNSRAGLYIWWRRKDTCSPLIEFIITELLKQWTLLIKSYRHSSLQKSNCSCVRSQSAVANRSRNVAGK